MNDSTLVIGGARSGKSRFALQLAEEKASGDPFFLATCIPCDEEMRERVLRHQRERGPHWKTLETPFRIADALSDLDRRAGVILVDCLTLWVSNLLFETPDEAEVERNVKELAHAIRQASCPVIFVSNEVGAGIVPENPMARRFRDVAGRVNQQVAAVCTRVFWMVAGLPVPVKGPNLQ